MANRKQREYRAQFAAFVPRIEKHARIYFRHVKCPETKADKVAETTGLAWKCFVRLKERGKKPEGFISTLASFAAKAVNSGRRVCGQEKAKDAMSSRAQQRHDFYVGKLPDMSTLSENPLAEALHDNTQTPPDDQAAFRIGFPSWVKLFSERDRRIIKAMMAETRTMDLSDQFGLSQGRISQMRREFKLAWDLY